MIDRMSVFDLIEYCKEHNYVVVIEDGWCWVERNKDE